MIYAAVDTVVLNPFDMADPDRVVSVGTEYPQLGPLGFFELLSGPEYADIIRTTEVMSEMAGFDLGNRQVMGTGQPQNLFTGFWWVDPPPVLDLQPVGPSFLEKEIKEREPVAMISHRVWVSRFAGDVDIVGSTIRIDDNPYTLIGVFPAAANIYSTDLWMPMWFQPDELPRASGASST